MEIIKTILLAGIGLASGVAVAGGVFAFISILGIIPRLCAKLRTASRVYSMETCIFLGGVAGCVVTVFQIPLTGGTAALGVFGLFAGIFVGCLAMALAETLKVFPVLARRTKLRVGLPLLIVAMAAGKFVGGLHQFFHN